jgi:hypothetical protein
MLEEPCLPRCLELCPCWFHDLKIWFESTARKTFFQWPKLVATHLGPDWNCTVDDAKPPQEISARSSLFTPVNFQSALILWFDKIEVPLMDVRN